MLSDEEIVDSFNRNVTRYFMNSTEQRHETYLSFQYMDGNHFEAFSREELRRNRPAYTMNVGAPLIRAVAGSEVMTAATMAFIAEDLEFDRQADLISDGLEWCQVESGYVDQRGIAATDAATAGIGAYVTYLDTTKRNFTAGKPICERIYPNFCFYDRSARGSMLNQKAWFCGYADPVDREWRDDYIDQMFKGKERPPATAADFKSYLLAYQTDQNYEHLEFIYHYFWKEWTDIYDVVNPLEAIEPDEPNELAELIKSDPQAGKLLDETIDKLQQDIDAQVWTLDKEELDELKDTMELIGMLNPAFELDELEYATRNGVLFYRAEFGDGMLLKKSRSYTQHGHAMNFITGYYEESTGQYYGMMRPISQLLDPLNMAFSDLMAYVKAASHGGSSWVKGAGEGVERIITDRRYEDEMTPVPKGTEIEPKALGNAPQVLQSTVTMLVDIMPRVLGLGPEFFGIITKGDMTDAMFGRVVKQSFAVLENWKNSSANSDKHQARVFEDLLREMIKANNNILFARRDAAGKEKDVIRAGKENFAREYALRVVEKPMTKDDKQEAFNTLVQLAPQMQQSGLNIYPSLIKLAPFDLDIKEALLENAVPKPSQPDPLQQETIKAQLEYTKAEAAKSAAAATKTNAEAQTMQTEETLNFAEKAADVELKEARAKEARAKAAQTANDMTNETIDRALGAVANDSSDIRPA